MSDRLACNQTEPSILAGCAQITDPLHKAVALQAAAAKVNFDWQQAEDVVAKIREELSRNIGSEASITHPRRVRRSAICLYQSCALVRCESRAIIEFSKRKILSSVSVHGVELS